MAERDPFDGEDFTEFLRKMFGADGAQLDPEQIERLTGMNVDPAMLQQMMRQMQGMFAQTSDGISWDMARTQALHIANQDGLSITSGQQTDQAQAFALANLWLSEATTIAELAAPAQTLTRGEWVEQTLPVWQELAEPVATSMSDALTETLGQQVPEDMQSMVEGAGRLMRNLGGTLFATQLGQVIGRLATEVVSGGDVGIPLLPAGEAAILPQNFAEIGRDLEIPEDQLALYLATRELAHARLFRHAKWLRLHVISQVTDFGRGVTIDVEALEDLAGRFDPSNPDELRQALESGSLLPKRSEAQQRALDRLENLLATIEGWVDVVTTDATGRLPNGERIVEVIRRRRAVGGPAERALSALVGLELRPRRLREAVAMWRALTDAVGVEARDALWDYPDFMPTADDIDDPQALVARVQARLRGDEPAADELDDALARILAGDTPDVEPDAAPTDGDADGRDDAGDGGGDGGPGGPRPV